MSRASALGECKDSVCPQLLRGNFSYRFLGEGQLINNDGPAIELTETPGAHSVAISDKASVTPTIAT